MNQEPRPSGTTIADELNKLARQLVEAGRLAWESEDRKRLQAEITDGLNKFGEQVETAARQARDSETTKQFSEQAQRVATQVKETRVVDEVRDGLITGLATLNRELSRLLDRLGERSAAAPVVGSAVWPPAPEPPAEQPPAGPVDPGI